MWHASTAITRSSMGGNVQGFSVIDTHIEGVKTGIFHQHGTTTAGEDPDGKLIGCSVQYRDVGFDIANVSKWRVALNGFRNEWDGSPSETPVYDMRFRAANVVSLVQNTFAVGGNPARVNMLIDADSTMNHVAHAMRFLIDAHQFGDNTSGEGASFFGISAIQITASATDIQIGASNQYLGPFSGAIVDDASGAAVTLAGFPGVPGDPTQPGVVAPSSADPAAGITTLGSGSGPWPASFSLGHYLPTNSSGITPVPPTTGWVFYTDSTGKLYAQYRDNGPILLLSP
ncbi:MAG TPA: hypothetical protein VG274_07260 [Rhizomicrobium sp.]|nr:hypothetical protein [Rhizomicrobium sp.]